MHVSHDDPVGDNSLPVAPLDGTIGGYGSLPGVPRTWRRVIDEFVDSCLHEHARAFRRAVGGQDSREVCGIFYLRPTGWDPQDGWGGRLHWAQIENKASGSGEFVMDQHQLALVLETQILARSVHARNACARYGLKVWEDVPSAVTVARYGDKPMDEVAQLVVEAIEDARSDLHTYGVFGGDWSVKGDELSAFEYLMLTGPQVLAGMGHTHPSGEVEASPQDLLAMDQLREWAGAWSYLHKYKTSKEIETPGTDRDVLLGSLGLEMSAGNLAGLVLGVRRDSVGSHVGYRDTGVVMYDRRGARAKWTR